MLTERLQTGDPIKLSPLGAERCPRIANKTGVVVQHKPDSFIVTVRFDGNRSTTAINRDYIEPIDDE